jgi:methanogenic corrinoid protein MtbC1
VADFATRLKSLRKERNLRQVDLAKEMGVAQTTIANYEQHSRFPDEDTLGNIATYFDVSMDYLLGRSDENPVIGKSNKDVISPEKLTPTALEYVRLLRGGDRDEAYSLILDAARRGLPVQEIYTDVLAPSMKEVGKLWEIGEIDIAEEHYFSEATESLMALLYPYLRRPQKKLGSVVAVAVNGEFHHIGLKMITDALIEEGWTCFYIGVNTPTADLIQAVDERKADILAVSATMGFNVDTVHSMIHRVRAETIRKGLKIIAGGQAFSENTELWQKVGADGFATSVRDAVELAASFAADR